MKKLRLVMEGFLVTGIAFATTALLYSDWLQANMTESVRLVTGLLTAPAVILGYAFGGVHSAGRGSFTVGLIVQLLAIWSMLRLVLGARAKSKQRN